MSKLTTPALQCAFPYHRITDQLLMNCIYKIYYKVDSQLIPQIITIVLCLTECSKSTFLTAIKSKSVLNSHIYITECNSK